MNLVFSHFFHKPGVPSLAGALLFAATFLCFPSLAGAQELHLMSYNMHHGADREENPTLEEMGRFINASGADLVGLQEVDSLCNRSGRVDQMKTLAAITGMHYAFARHFAYDGGAYGLGILSRYPISDIQNHRITSKSGNGSLALLAVKVTLPGGKQIRFMTVHYALDKPTRLIQSSETLALSAGSLPVILTGDLNAEPQQEEITQLGKFFAFCDPAGKFTFPDRDPVKKIDYILVSKHHLDQTVKATVWDDIHYSDHLPLSATIKLK
ncbi:MAG: endonuclease/exonuclease/phosphatase family protein [Solitalea sp.]